MFNKNVNVCAVHSPGFTFGVEGGGGGMWAADAYFA